MPKKSPWRNGSKHNWKTTHKTRHDPGKDVVEEIYAERSIYVLALLTVVVCVSGWWWQAVLDGWIRGIVLSVTTVVTVYIVAMGASLILFGLVARFIRHV